MATARDPGLVGRDSGKRGNREGVFVDKQDERCLTGRPKDGIMTARIRNRFHRPVVTLVLSFLIGVVIDAVAERAHAGPGYQQEATIRPADNPAADQQEPAEPSSAGDSPMQDQSQFDKDLPLMRLDDIYQPLQDIDIDIRYKSPNRPPDLSYQLYRDNYSTNYPGSFQERLASWDCAGHSVPTPVL